VSYACRTWVTWEEVILEQISSNLGGKARMDVILCSQYCENTMEEHGWFHSAAVGTLCEFKRFSKIGVD